MKFLGIIAIAIAMQFSTVQVSANDQQCFPDKVLGSATVNGKLKSFCIEEVMDIPSDVTFDIKGKELSLIADPEVIEKLFRNKEGKKFQVTYEKVYGWIGDGCDQYERLVKAKQIR